MAQLACPLFPGVPYISYYTTKSATLGFSRGVALQYAKDNIRSNVIMRGLMKTPFVVEPLKEVYGGGHVNAMMDKRDNQCPMDHMATPGMWPMRPCTFSGQARRQSRRPHHLGNTPACISGRLNWPSTRFRQRSAHDEKNRQPAIPIQA